MTKEDFYLWKTSPVTEAVFAELKARMELLKEELVEQTAYMSQSEMAEKAGAIKAIRDVLAIEFEQETE